MKGYYQAQNQWCWAATSQTVRKHTKGTYRWQCKMASALVAKSSDLSYCCGSNGYYERNPFPNSFHGMRCNKPSNQKEALKWNGVFQASYNGLISHYKIMQQFGYNDPVVVSVNWTRTTGHAMVLYGGWSSSYTGTQYYNLWNPGKNSGAEVISRSGLLKYKGGSFAYSYTTN